MPEDDRRVDSAQGGSPREEAAVRGPSHAHAADGSSTGGDSDDGGRWQRPQQGDQQPQQGQKQQQLGAQQPAQVVAKYPVRGLAGGDHCNEGEVKLDVDSPFYQWLRHVSGELVWLTPGGRVACPVCFMLQCCLRCVGLAEP